MPLLWTRTCILVSGTDIHVASPGGDNTSVRQIFLNKVARAHTDVTRAVRSVRFNMHWGSHGSLAIRTPENSRCGLEWTCNG